MRQPPFFPAQRAWRIVAAVGILSVIGFFAWLPKNSPIGLPGSVCLFREVTGLPCALCGGTRAAKAALHGDFHRALHINAIALPALALLILIALIIIIEASLGRALLNWRVFFVRYRIIFPIGLALIILWWIPQMAGALTGKKAELIDLRNPIARFLSAPFRPTQP